MSIDGRISVDALFYDRDGDTALNVLSLRSSSSDVHTQVAVMSGSVDTAGISFAPDSGITYRNASGQLVSFSSVHALAIQGTDLIVEAYGYAGSDEEPTYFSSLYSDGEVSVTRLPYVALSFRVRAANDNSTYAIMLCGT